MTVFPDTNKIYGILMRLNKQRKTWTFYAGLCCGGYYRLSGLPDATQVGMFRYEVDYVAEFYTEKEEYLDRLKEVLVGCITVVHPKVLEVRQLRDTFKSIYKKELYLVSLMSYIPFNVTVPVFDSNAH